MVSGVVAVGGANIGSGMPAIGLCDFQVVWVVLEEGCVLSVGRDLEGAAPGWPVQQVVLRERGILGAECGPGGRVGVAVGKGHGALLLVLWTLWLLVGVASTRDSTLSVLLWQCECCSGGGGCCEGRGC